jgi:hypothetical protein
MDFKLKQRQLQRNVALLSGALILVSILFFIFYFQFGNLKKAYAANNYYTLNDGDWATSVWSNTTNGGPNCGCNPGGNFNKVANVSKKITISTYTPFKLSGGGVINIIGSGRIIMNSNVELSGGSQINIANGDSIILNGNLLVSASNIDVSGYFRVNGNVTMTGGSTVCGTGTAFLNGTLSGTTWCGGIALPVKLLYFNVNQNGGIVETLWATATEINNSFFTVERSKDGTNFEEVSKIHGAGNSTSQRKYSASDSAPVKGLSFYRLKQTDFDGKGTYSPVKSLQFGSQQGNNKIEIQNIGPNPFKNNFNVNYSIPVSSEVEIQIINFYGQLLFDEKINSSKGFNIYSFNNNKELPSGTYLIRMISNGEVAATMVFKE